MKITVKRAVLGIVLLTAVSAGAAYSMGVVEKPSAGLIDKGDWVTGEKIQVESSAYIYNPNPLALNLTNFSADYRLKMNDVVLADGNKKGLQIPKNDNRTISFRTDLRTANIPEWWVTHLRNDESSKLEIPIKAGLKVSSFPLSFSGYSYTDTIETDVEGSLSSAISKIEGNYSRTYGSSSDFGANSFKIEVVDASAKFGEVTRSETGLVMPLTIRNRNDYPIPAPKLGGELKLNSVELAEFESEGSGSSIPPGETREVIVNAGMSNERIDEWFKSHVRKGEKTDAELNVYFRFDVGDASFRIPSDDGMTCRFDFATAILVDEKAETEGFQGCSGIIRKEDGGSGEDEGVLGGSDDSGGSNSTDDDDGSSIGGLL